MSVNKPKLLASSISDLTIARYLAAMEVEFIGVNLDDETINLDFFLNQLREWVAGPELIGFSNDITKIERLLAESRIDGYVIENHFHLKNKVYPIQNSNQENRAIPFISIYKAHMQINSDENIFAWLIQPGKEVKTGLFDFDEIDSVMRIFGRAE